MQKAFRSKKINNVADTVNGFTTGDNNTFLRLWYEVSNEQINLTAGSHEDAQNSEKKWFPYNKGGSYRKWYGNNDYLINWLNNGAEIKAYGHLVPRSLKYMFLSVITIGKRRTFHG